MDRMLSTEYQRRIVMKTGTTIHGRRWDEHGAQWRFGTICTSPPSVQLRRLAPPLDRPLPQLTRHEIDAMVTGSWHRTPRRM
jgi:hypothetical protein